MQKSTLFFPYNLTLKIFVFAKRKRMEKQPILAFALTDFKKVNYL